MRPDRQSRICRAAVTRGLVAAAFSIGCASSTQAAIDVTPPPIPRAVRQAAATGRALIERMQRADARICFIGVQTSRVSYPGGIATSQQRMYRLGNRSLRLDFLSGPGGLAGETIVDNGTTFYHYLPARRTMDEGPSRLHRERLRARQMLDLIKSGQVTARNLGRDEVAGRSCTIVELRLADTSAPWRAFWVDDATGVQLKNGQYRNDGSILSSSALTEVRFVDSIPVSTFAAPKVAAGTHVQRIAVPHKSTVAEVQARAGFPIKQPTYIPSGYQFDAAGMSRFYGAPMVTLRYTDGPRVISLFEMQGTGASEGPSHPTADVSISFVGGLKIVAVGGATGDMDRMLASMR